MCVKVLVHSVQEDPLTKELGIAISPGTESFIAIRNTEVCTGRWFYTLGPVALYPVRPRANYLFTP